MDGLGGLFLPRQPSAAARRGGEKVLSSPTLESVTKEIQGGIDALQGTGKVLLVIDQLDLLLAAGGEQFGAVNVEDMLMGLREVCWSTTREMDLMLMSNSECACDDHDAFCRPAPGVKSPNPFRVKSCGSSAKYGSSSGFHHELEAAGFWDREGR